MFTDWDESSTLNQWDEPPAEIDWDDSLLLDDVPPPYRNGFDCQYHKLHSSLVKPMNAGSIAGVIIPSASSSHLSSSLDCSSHPPDLLRERQELINSVATTCALPQHIAQRLLDHCGWNVNTTVEQFFNDRAGLLGQIGLCSPALDTPSLTSLCSLSSSSLSAPSATSCCSSSSSSTSSASLPKRKRRANRKIECSVCFTDTTIYTQVEVCGHTFCNECWTHHFELQIKERNSIISCMGMGCKIPISEATLSSILSPESYQKYLVLMQRYFVQRSSDIRFCPNQDCNLVVRNPVLWKNCRTGTCSCGHQFCFDCDLPAHSPATCDMMKKWNLSEQWKSDQASTAWILRNTKDCPKCNVPIQKDRGCFLMVCRGQNCKYRFCWLCGGDWSTHPDHFACATFNEVDMKDQPEWRDGSSLSPSRILRANEARYYTMYQEHDRASRFEAQSQKQIEEHIASLQDTTSTFYLYNVDFVRDAYAIMFTVRYFLKHTYIYSLYISETPEWLVFQHQQSRLEMIAEKLSAVLEPAEVTSDQRRFDPEKLKALTLVARTTFLKMAELDHL